MRKAQQRGWPGREPHEFVGTPQNAVVYGSGMIPITKMVRSGAVFDVIGLLLIVLLIPVMAGLILA